MRRRTLLSVVGGGLVSLAGCTTGPGTGTVTDDGAGTAPDTDDPATDSPDTDLDTDTDDRTATDTPTTEATPTEAPLPEDCPTSQGFDVEWPTDLDAAAVESFVEAYEQVYYREVVVDYEPESRLDSYELSGHVSEGPTRVDDGWTVTYSGSGGVYRPTLSMAATTAQAPEGVEPVAVSEVDDDPLVETLRTAAETGSADYFVEPPGEPVERYLELLGSLSEGFSLSEPGDSDSLYVDVDGTTVELTVSADTFHGDYWWGARYYVDEHVVRRTDEDGVDPREGELLECRSGD